MHRCGGLRDDRDQRLKGRDEAASRKISQVWRAWETESERGRDLAGRGEPRAEPHERAPRPEGEGQGTPLLRAPPGMHTRRAGVDECFRSARGPDAKAGCFQTRNGCQPP